MGTGKAYFNSLGMIYFLTSDNIGQTMFSLLDLTVSTKTSFSSIKITSHFEVADSLVQGKLSLGHMYAGVICDTGSLLSKPALAGSGIIKLETIPSLSSTWDYVWHANAWLT